MNLKRLIFGFGLTLALAGQTLHAQPSDADGKQLADIRAQAEKGDAKSQCALGRHSTVASLAWRRIMRRR